ncbi:MAG: hypothetical protein KY455_09325 [Euryarchaeota archaeon]|nr:hypothetical protein [Euryarchaeota archaeon]
MKAPTSAPHKTSRSDTARNWLVAARVPGITFALAALLLPTAAAGALAPGTLDTALVDLPVPDEAGAPADTIPSGAAEDEASAAPPAASTAYQRATGHMPFTTGQKLTPEEIAWFQAEAEELRAQGVLRGHAVWSH